MQQEVAKKDAVESVDWSARREFRQQLLLALFTGLFAMIGAAGGTLLTALTTRSQWERSIDYEQRRMILDRRVDVSERMVRIINKGPRVSMLRDRVGVNAEIARLRVRQAKEDSARSGEDLVKDADEALKELHELNAEFGAAASLAIMFFGPETKKALSAINDGNAWWQATPEKNQALMDAMSKELAYWPAEAKS